MAVRVGLRSMVVFGCVATAAGAVLAFAVVLGSMDPDPLPRLGPPAVSAIGVTLVIGFLVGWGIARLFALPLPAALRRLRHRSAASDPDEPGPSGALWIREVDDLIGHLDRIGRGFRSEIDGSRGETKELSTLLEALHEGIAALTPDGRIVRSNRAARRILGIPDERDSDLARSLVRSPELRRLFEEALRRSLPLTELELDGRWISLSGQLDGSGTALVSLSDVTEVRRLERVRADFVANASHELKTPLTAMRGFAETLLDDDPPPAERQRFLRAVRDNTLRLQRLVDDLLDLSRLESGGWVAEPARIRARESVDRTWRDFAGRAEEQGTVFAVEGDAMVLADPRALDQILRNLFENAVRHTREGRIRVLIEPTSQGVRFVVEDTGDGISAADLPRIFERFYRADASRSRDRGGTGLGLAIVKHLVESMDGTVGADSAVGRGTSIHFTLSGAATESEPDT